MGGGLPRPQALLHAVLPEECQVCLDIHFTRRGVPHRSAACSLQLNNGRAEVGGSASQGTGDALQGGAQALARSGAHGCWL